jgi:hypothetical protein
MRTFLTNAELRRFLLKTVARNYGEQLAMVSMGILSFAFAALRFAEVLQLAGTP